MSNNCINISILLDYYLAHLGVASRVYCGALKAPGDDSNALMHVFLKVEEELVDNTYVHIEEKVSAQDNINQGLCRLGLEFFSNGPENIYLHQTK